MGASGGDSHSQTRTTTNNANVNTRTEAAQRPWPLRKLKIRDSAHSLKHGHRRPVSIEKFTHTLTHSLPRALHRLTRFVIPFSSHYGPSTPSQRVPSASHYRSAGAIPVHSRTFRQKIKVIKFKKRYETCTLNRFINIHISIQTPH